ncbi:DUF3052 domain-containing protein [Solicola sp. PLA-1-18]|uniref:DUF3052 domain-containing protein n=1 Tax=Solicola sp. PLA-1-18 TaxID=3380532 RepID=UPI003B7732CD
MSATARDADGPQLAQHLGFEPSTVVQELGWDEDVDDDLRLAIEEVTGNELVDGEYGDVVSGVLFWWRDGDGDLVDALVDSLRDLDEGGGVWLLTPKVGRDGYVDNADIAEAAPVAGLVTTTTSSAGADWAATRLAAPKGQRR